VVDSGTIEWRVTTGKGSLLKDSFTFDEVKSVEFRGGTDTHFYKIPREPNTLLTAGDAGLPVVIPMGECQLRIVLEAGVNYNTSGNKWTNMWKLLKCWYMYANFEQYLFIEPDSVPADYTHYTWITGQSGKNAGCFRGCIESISIRNVAAEQWFQVSLVFAVGSIGYAIDEEGGW